MGGKVVGEITRDGGGSSKQLPPVPFWKIPECSRWCEMMFFTVFLPVTSYIISPPQSFQKSGAVVTKQRTSKVTQKAPSFDKRIKGFSSPILMELRYKRKKVQWRKQQVKVTEIQSKDSG